MDNNTVCNNNVDKTECRRNTLPTRRFSLWFFEFRSILLELKRLASSFRRSKLSLVGLCITLLLIALALTGSYIAPYPGDATGDTRLGSRLQPPSADHLFGTDVLGRDVFSRVIIGTRLALELSLSVLVVAIIIGVPIGVISGYIGGIFDDIVMRITDVFITIPYLILAIAVAAALGPGMRNAALALSMVWWASYCRLMRGEVLRVREEMFVLASRSMGASRATIIWKHILPNALTPIIVRASMDMGNVLLAAAILGFIGLGVRPPEPEWGALVSEGRRVFPMFWWVATFPGFAIFIAVLGFNLLGDGIRDVLEPTSRR